MAEDAPTAPLNRVEAPAKAFGKTRLIHKERATRRAAAVIGQRRDDFVAKLLEEGWVTVIPAHDHVTQAYVPAVAVVRVIAREQVHLRRHRHVVDVPLAVRNDLQTGSIRPHPDHTAAMKLHSRSIFARGLGGAIVAAGDVKKAVDAHAHPVDRVIRSAELQAEAEACHQILRAIAHAVAVVVMIGGDKRRVLDIEHMVVEPDTARRIHGGEGHEAVGLAIAIGVGAAHDPAAPWLRIDRSVLVNADVEVAVRGSAQACWIADMRRRGEERYVPSGRRLDAFRHINGPTRDRAERRDEKQFGEGRFVH